MNGKKRPTAIRCCQPFHDVKSAVALRATLCTFRSKKLFTFHFSLFTSEGPVAHAAGGAQSRDDGGDDAADDLEDGLPRFLFHGVKWFLVG